MQRDSHATSRLAVVTDERFDGHVPPGFHPERPERRAAAVRGAARVEAPRVAVEARDARRDELARVHAEDYLDRLARALDGPAGYLDADTYFSAGSRGAAWRAAGGACALVEALLEGRADAGALLCRPPGHHATRDRAMGFCLLNNVAVGAAHARSLGVDRVAIVDWDVHHGNGTQDVFADDPSVLFVSLHQMPLYPGTGHAKEVGEGRGRGFTVNVPLPPGADGGTYATAFDRVVLPLLGAVRPGFVLVSAGYDAHALDPLAGMRLDAAAYGWMASRLREVGAPVGVVLEGGYDLTALEDGVHATLAGLVAPGDRGAVRPRLANAAEERALDAVIDAQKGFWPGVLG